MNFNGLKPPINLNNFDVELQDFYNEVLHKEMNIRKQQNIQKIRNSLHEVVNAYRKETVTNYCSNINFDSAAKRCAYVFKHCPGFTSAVARHLKQLLECNPSILQEPLLKRKINVCCLGGGPASDAVAISKIVSSVQDSFWIRDRRPLEFRVTVVDLSEGWKTTARHVLKTLEETPHFFDSEKISLSFQFHKADLTQPMDQAVKDVIQNADLITMVYFLSAVNGSKVKDKSSQMLQQLMKNMKLGALLFFLDSSKELHYEGINEVAKIFDDLKQIYGPVLQEFHTLSLNSVRRYFQIYSRDFRSYICLTNCFITVSSWMKVDYILDNQNTFASVCPTEEKQSVGRNSLHKKMSYKSLKVVNFREKVQSLLMKEFGLHVFIDGFEDTEDVGEYMEDSSVSDVYKVFYATKPKRKRIFSEG